MIQSNYPMKKHIYVAPMVENISVKTYGLLDSLSMAVSDTPAWGGGDAKRGSFDDDTEQQDGWKSYSPWE